MGSRPGVEILSERAKTPADGSSSTRICIRFKDNPGESVHLRLSKGSFSESAIQREITVPVENNEANLLVYAHDRPGVGWLSGPGFRHKIEFVAVSFMQGLLYEWIPTIVMALGLALVLKSFVVASFYIPSGSMENTLKQGDLLIADKLSFKLLGQDPQRGDIMIFRYPKDPKKDYIKRVIGLPGDMVKIHHGRVYVNGEALIEDDYIKEQPLLDYSEVEVPEGSYFVMGDNRNHSSDSRVWGFVPRDNIEGRALFVFWPRPRLLDNHEPVAVAAEPEH
ncbi:MAG: signal peptidase I [bacterium]